MPRQMTDDELDALLMGGAGRSTQAAPPGMSDDALDALILGQSRAPASPSPAPTTMAGPPKKRTARSTPALPFDPTVTTFHDPAAESKVEEPLGADAAVGRAIVDGVPIVGRYLTAGMDRAIAAGRSRSFGGPEFDHELGRVQRQGKATEEAHPWATTGGNLLGSVVAMAPAMAAAPGVMGLTGSMGTRTLWSGASNAAIGAADGTVRHGPEEAIQGAMTGGGAGLAGPFAGRVIGAGIGKVGNALTDMLPINAARRVITDSLESAGNKLGAVWNELSGNKRLALMDVSPDLQLYAQRLAKDPSAARTILATAAAERAETSPAAVRGAFDASLGSTPNVKDMIDGLKATANRNGKANFEAALKGAQPVDLNGLPDATVRKISEAWDRGFSKFPDRSQLRFTQPEMLHLAQQELRREAETLGSSAVGSERLASADVHNIRQQLVDRIDHATGGRFRPAQAKFADDKAVEEAFGRGMDIFAGGTGAKAAENHPDFWRATIAAMTPDEQAAVRQGVRVAVSQRIGNARSAARAGREITDSEFNVDKLKAVLGEDEAAKLSRALRDEHRIAATNSKVMAGSKTAETSAVDAATRVRQPASMFSAQNAMLPVLAGTVGSVGHALTGSPYALAAGAGVLGYGVARRGVQAIGQRFDTARNTELARMLSATGPERTIMMQALANRGAAPSAMASYGDRGVNMLTDASGVSPAFRNPLTDAPLHPSGPMQITVRPRR